MIYLGIVGALTFSAIWDRVQPVFQLPGGRGWPVVLWHRAVFLAAGGLVEALALPGWPLVGITPEPARINAHRH